MFHSQQVASARGLGWPFAIALIALLLAASPAAAWSGNQRISSANYNALMFDNDLLLADDPYVQFFYSNEYGPSYRRTAFSNLTQSTTEHAWALTGDQGDAEAIAEDGSLLAMAYRDYDQGNKLFVIVSTNRGNGSFGNPVRVAFYGGLKQMGNASLAVSGQTVLVAWTDHRNGHVNLRRSTNGGASYGPVTLLGTSKAVDILGAREAQVHLAASGSGLIATWNQSISRGHPARLVMRRSTDSGATFKPVKTLDPGQQAYDGPSIVMVGRRVFISHATKPGSVQVLRSLDGGQHFTSTGLSGARPTNDRTDIAVDPANPDSLAVVWYAKGNNHIYLRRSSDGGTTWTPTEDTGARGEEASTVSPNVVISGTHVVVVWNSVVDDDFVWLIIAARIDG